MRADYLTAWRTMLTGLKHNPAYAEGIERARLIWRFMPRDQRSEALQFLRETFGTDASQSVEQWEAALTAPRDGDAPESHLLNEDMEHAAERMKELFRGVWPMPSESPANTRPAAPPQPKFDPNAPTSAAEGQAT